MIMLNDDADWNGGPDDNSDDDAMTMMPWRVMIIPKDDADWNGGPYDNSDDDAVTWWR